MPYVIYRVQKLHAGSRGSGSLGQALKHLQNHTTSAEIAHPERTCENMLHGGNYKKVMSKIKKHIDDHNKHHARSFRSDAAIACEMILSYSPEIPSGKKDKKGKDIMQPYRQDLESALEFEKKILDFLHKQYPDMQIAGIARHMDEESVHWHVIGLCFNEKTHTMSVRQMIGGPKDLQKAQTVLADLCEDIGLERGISKSITKKNHLTKQEYNRQKLTHQKRLQDIELAHRAKILEESNRAVLEVLGDFDR